MSILVSAKQPSVFKTKTTSQEIEIPGNNSGSQTAHHFRGRQIGSLPSPSPFCIFEMDDIGSTMIKTQKIQTEQQLPRVLDQRSALRLVQTDVTKRVTQTPTTPPMADAGAIATIVNKIAVETGNSTVIERSTVRVVISPTALPIQAQPVTTSPVQGLLAQGLAKAKAKREAADAAIVARKAAESPKQQFDARLKELMHNVKEQGTAIEKPKPRYPALRRTTSSHFAPLQDTPSLG